MNFDILRDMESFTQTMFNNIIGFQEKDHPAWNESLPFDQRIKDLPLHYLIFSNPDRNPETHGPTIAHYYPLHEEMLTIARYANKVAEYPVVLDVHARNGFIGTLLAKEGVKVIGLRDPEEKPNQIENFYDPALYELRDGTIEDADFPVDVVFSSWMPADEDISEQIARLNPKLVVYIYTDHVNENTGQRQTGTATSFGDNLPRRFQLIETWSLTRPKDLLREIWPDLTGNIEETRHVRIFANEGFHDVEVEDTDETVAPYPWENELIMAQTAYQAKQEMIKRGFPAGY